MRFSPRLIPIAAATAVALLIAGCGAADSTTDPSTTGGTTGAGDPAAAPISVVTSTNVYASIASRVGGKSVSVSAILSDPAADPHSFEISAQDQVKIAKAQLVIANGGGYDDFAQQMVDAADPAPQLIDAVKVSGLPSDSDDFNEHVFYNLDAMTKLGNEIAAKLGEMDPAGKATFTKNAADFAVKLSGLQKKAAAVGAAHPELKAVVTEPVADYLLETAGISDVTPAGFSKAIEAENDPAPGDVAEVDTLLTGKTVGLVVFNSQTAGPVTERLESKAQELGIPVLKVTETLPEGVSDYADWIGGTIDRLDKALG